MKTPPLVEIRQLEMRFGGVAAVCQVDLNVEAKSIFSVIGPNGAGKTTLFNCITGLATPTAGTIRFFGQDLRRRWGRRMTFACLAAGLAWGLALAVVAIDVDGLWRAAIRRPTSYSDTPFSARRCWEQLVAYVRGDLAIERHRRGRWQIVSADGRVPLAVADSRQRAQALRDELDRLSRQTREARAVRRRGDWIIESGSDSKMPAAGPFPSRHAAEESLSTLAQIDRARVRKRRLAGLAFLLGVVLGPSGIWAAWRRARWTPELVARAGVARTFQNLRLFQRMTVRDNVVVALDQARRKSTFLSGRARQRQTLAQQGLAEADALLKRVGLAHHGDRLAGQLSYGDQRRLEIARALATRPRLLLLDEPAAGMNDVETAALARLVRGLKAEGLTVVLIEHQMELVMGISDRIAVLDGGRKIAEGLPDEVRRDPAVLEAYLG